MENPLIHSALVMGIIEQRLKQELEEAKWIQQQDQNEYENGYVAGISLALLRTEQEIASIEGMLKKDHIRKLNELRKSFL